MEILAFLRREDALDTEQTETETTDSVPLPEMDVARMADPSLVLHHAAESGESESILEGRLFRPIRKRPTMPSQPHHSERPLCSISSPRLTFARKLTSAPGLSLLGENANLRQPISASVVADAFSINSRSPTILTDRFDALTDTNAQNRILLDRISFQRKLNRKQIRMDSRDRRSNRDSRSKTSFHFHSWGSRGKAMWDREGTCDERKDRCRRRGRRGGI
jgi:hypothetical protein